MPAFSFPDSCSSSARRSSIGLWQHPTSTNRGSSPQLPEVRNVAYYLVARQSTWTDRPGSGRIVVVIPLEQDDADSSSGALLTTELLELSPRSTSLETANRLGRTQEKERSCTNGWKLISYARITTTRQ